MLVRLAWFPLAIALVATSSPAQEPTAPATATNPAVPAAGHSIHGEAFNDGPRRKAILIPGMGKVDFPVTTTRPEAQAFITQGVGQLHSFFYLEAERSFRQAAQIDPACPMSYWGMAMANVNNAKRAKGFMKEAKGRAVTTKISRREQLYLDALDALYKDGDDKARKKEHLLGWEAIVAEFPADLEARAWMAMVTWQNAASDGIGSRQAVDMVLESILDKESMHPGAHHYRIHLWDHVKPARAEKAAALYAPSAPGIAHAWHMPGHTYTELKRYADAAYQQEGSARVDHAYMIRDRIMPFEIHNYAHNNQWLATSLSHVGRAGDAILVARNLVEQPRDPQRNGSGDGGSAQRSGRLRWVETLIRYEMWDALLLASNEGRLDWSDVPLEKVEHAYSMGLALAGTNNPTALAAQIEALKKLPESRRTSTPPAPTPKPGEPAPAPAPPAPAAHLGLVAELEGYQQMARGDILAALGSFAKATRMTPETLARVHLSARNFGLAEAQARLAVEKSPQQFLPLATLVEALHANNKDDEAKDLYRKLGPMIVHADPSTPIARRLTAITDGWKSSGSWSPTATLATPTDETIATTRVNLEPLGPLAWSPSPAEPISLTTTDGKPWNLADHKGRNVIALFYLGGKCAHCLQQLQDFGKQSAAFDAIQTDVVAIGTDSIDDARALKANADGIKFPMPFLADPALEVFKKYQAFDDFENQPLHGVFLIDPQGNVRFQKVSPDPFLDVDFLKGEAARINKLLK